MNEPLTQPRDRDEGEGADESRVTSDYLWDRSEPVDAEIERLERLLSPMRYQPGPASIRAPRPFWLRPLPLAAAALLAFSVGGAWLAATMISPGKSEGLGGGGGAGSGGEGWSVVALAGVPQVGAGKLQTGAGTLRQGEWLRTDSSSRAEVAVANIGHVTVEPDSRLRLIESSAAGHRLELARGRIGARISAPPRLFFVETPSATAIDLGCAYELVVNDDGSGELHVTLGWVSLDRQVVTKGGIGGAGESIVPRGAVCLTRLGVGPGTPFYDDASDRLKRELMSFDFEGGGSDALRAVLDEARPRDSLTLWHLLARTSADDRAAVFDRLAFLDAPPEGVAREAVLRGDAAALQRWRDAFIWSPLPPVSRVPVED